ncbi:MAG: tetratricopeptide repeat protein [Pyrinomonadaceae bacterium]|nr:tetratricopeptide repeat protein [Pyrinomonadaceae bacterium]
MQALKAKLSCIVLLALAALCSSACGGSWASSPPAAPPPALPPAAPLTADGATDRAIRFLEDRVKRDPEDFGAYNKLAAYYLERLRETGNTEYLNLTFRAARSSLESVPAERNSGGLAALTQAKFASHEFAAARDHALQLRELEPGKSYPYQMLGDALLELGDYDGATAAFQSMERLGGSSVNTETRLARLALLRGAIRVAQQRYSKAIALALNLPVPPRETVAWCRWQLGETAFAGGDYETAEQHYRDALVTFPVYYNALASLGRVRAARGDLQGAIEHYEQVVRRLPDPSFVAALGDLYKLAGREKEAATQYQLVEQTARLSKLNGELYNRQLALFYADHDMKAEEAFRQVVSEYEVRRDIYGADAVAWTALKAGKIREAQVAIKEALRLGTPDAKLFYHAGMIARAAGDELAARDYLQRALTLNPQFDPLQALIARKALEG